MVCKTTIRGFESRPDLNMKKITKFSTIDIIFSFFFLAFVIIFPDFRNWFHNYFLIILGNFGLVSLFLFLQIYKKKPTKLIKNLKLLSFSGLGFVVGSILHNFLSVVPYLGFLSAISFLFSIIVCPILFLIALVKVILDK